MNDMIYKTYNPNKFLKPYISRIFVLESKFGIHKSDFGLIAPNGRIKLVIPYKSNFNSTINNITREHKKSSCAIIGQSTYAAEIVCDKDYGTIMVEFNPIGAYRFFKFSLNEIVNQIHNVPDVFDSVGKELQERVSEITEIDKKVLFVEEFLYGQMVSLNKSDPVTEYAVNKIIMNNGLINISTLSEEVGYSRRYLLSIFTEKVGLSPKEFACIMRFRGIYEKIHLIGMDEEKLYELYYDQSHFIKEFKKFTGKTPGEYLNQSINLGKILLND